jgi:hypothetical protein
MDCPPFLRDTPALKEKSYPTETYSDCSAGYIARITLDENKLPRASLVAVCLLPKVDEFNGEGR